MALDALIIEKRLFVKQFAKSNKEQFAKSKNNLQSQSQKMAAKQKTSDVMNYFFKTCPDDDNYRTCKNPTCANRDLKLKCKQGSGYTNLRNHLLCFAEKMAVSKCAPPR